MNIRCKIIIFMVFVSANAQNVNTDSESQIFPINVHLGAHVGEYGKWENYVEVNNLYKDNPKYHVGVLHNTTDTGITMTAYIEDFLTLQVNCSHDKHIFKEPERRFDYTHFPGLGYYKYHKGPVTWYQAFQTCESEGAYLAVINSAEESAMLSNLVSPNPVMTVTPGWAINYAHIGFHSLFKKGEYVTVKGQPYLKAGFSKFSPGEPNNLGGKEFCGSIYRRNGQLNDILCEATTSFVCERDNN